MKFTLEKNPSKIFLFTTLLLLLVIPCRKVTNSAGTGARQSATDSAQFVDQITTIYESKPLAFKAAVHICDRLWESRPLRAQYDF